MHYVVLLADLIALGLAAAAAFHTLYLARIAPRARLRGAWLAMTGLLAVVIVLGTFSTLDRLLSQAFNISVLIDCMINLLGAAVIFAAILLSRLTADDVLKVAELERAAYTDKLTGLPNRRSFDLGLPAQIEIARRRTQPLVLLMLDIDRFKRVNDENGHACGDRVLAHLGQILATHERRGDTAFRIGGEEFAVLAPHTSIVQGRAAAERLRLAIESAPLLSEERPIAITVSFGVAALRPEDDGASLAKRADEALYLAKRTGRNRVCTEDDLAVPARVASHP
jgi:diguanylate cyclase (GGDEF)-like protein